MRASDRTRCFGQRGALSLPSLVSQRQHSTARLSGSARHLIAFAVVGSSALCSLNAETPRALQPEDFAALRDVEEPNLSPDGSAAVYVVKTVDLGKDKQPANLWLAKWDGSENRALTFDLEKQNHPRWSPDGKWIGFLSSRTDEHENDQLWILSGGGGEAERVTEIKGSLDDFAWSPDSKRIVLVIHEPDPREPEAKEKEKKTVPPLVIDRTAFQTGHRGISHGALFASASARSRHAQDRATDERSAR